LAVFEISRTQDFLAKETMGESWMIIDLVPSGELDVLNAPREVPLVPEKRELQKLGEPWRKQGPRTEQADWG
jgi:hypothetical protein